MDVTVSVYLAGGHVWEFVCDEADPMAVGLVSALPGATSAPPTGDGLIQVETRTGERLYLTRESLVAVSIKGRAPLLPVAVSAGKLQGAVALPAPFALLPGCFEPEDEPGLIAAIAQGTIGPVVDAAATVELAALPPSVSTHLIRAIAEARKVLGLGQGESFLDLAVHVAGVGSAVAMPVGQAGDILSFAVVVPAAGGAVDTAIELHDQDTVTPGAGGPSGRVLALKAGTLLALPAGVATGPLRPELRAGGEAIVLTGRLVAGAAGD